MFRNKTQSVKHDAAIWELEQIQRVQAAGNERTKRVFEARLPSYYLLPSETDDFAVREKFIRDKYEAKAFVLEGAVGPGERNPEKHPFCRMPQPQQAFDVLYRGGAKKKERKLAAVLVNSYVCLYNPKKVFLFRSNSVRAVRPTHCYYLWVCGFYL